MLVSAAVGFCLPTKPSTCVTKFGSNHPKMYAFSDKYHQTHSSSTKCCHSPASQLAAAAAAVDNKGHGGIGILDFYKGKNIFVIGATGLLGKGTIYYVYMHMSKLSIHHSLRLYLGTNYGLTYLYSNFLIKY